MEARTLDEIEARWKQTSRTTRYYTLNLALADLDATIEMVRARDRVVEAARWVRKADHTNGEIHKALAALDEAVAALDTPPAQESTK